MTRGASSRETEARTWMQAARALIIDRFPYLDVAVTSMVLVASPGLGTVAVDRRWRLYYDPERVLHLVEQHGVSVLCSDWIHEVMHLLRDHPTRWEGLRDHPGRHRIFNIAGDALVNRDVAELHLPILDTDVTFQRLPAAAQCHAGMMTEEIYRRLVPFYDTVAAADPAGRGPASQPVEGCDCGSGSGGGRRGWELEIDGDGDSEADGSVDSARSVAIRESTAMQVRASGVSHRALRAWADDVIEPQVDWREELRSVVSRRLGLSAGVRDYSFARPSRRQVPGFTLPGMTGPAAPRVIAIVDTSGSMDRDTLDACLGELLGLIRTRTTDSPGLTVVACDDEVNGIQVIRTARELQRLQLLGGGGTDMGVGLAWAAQQRPLPDVVVVLTDGETPWPTEAPKGLGSVLVLAVIIEQVTEDKTAQRWGVPDWIRLITISSEGATVAGDDHDDD